MLHISIGWILVELRNKRVPTTVCFCSRHFTPTPNQASEVNGPFRAGSVSSNLQPKVPETISFSIKPPSSIQLSFRIKRARVELFAETKFVSL
jgi:hypothetical protein